MTEAAVSMKHLNDRGCFFYMKHLNDRESSALCDWSEELQQGQYISHLWELALSAHEHMPCSSIWDFLWTCFLQLKRRKFILALNSADSVIGSLVADHAMDAACHHQHGQPDGDGGGVPPWCWWTTCSLVCH